MTDNLVIFEGLDENGVKAVIKDKVGDGYIKNIEMYSTAKNNMYVVIMPQGMSSCAFVRVCMKMMLGLGARGELSAWFDADGSVKGVGRGTLLYMTSGAEKDIDVIDSRNNAYKVGATDDKGMYDDALALELLGDKEVEYVPRKSPLKGDKMSLSFRMRKRGRFEFVSRSANRAHNAGAIFSITGITFIDNVLSVLVILAVCLVFIYGVMAFDQTFLPFSLPLWIYFLALLIASSVMGLVKKKYTWSFMANASDNIGNFFSTCLYGILRYFFCIVAVWSVAVFCVFVPNRYLGNGSYLKVKVHVVDTWSMKSNGDNVNHYTKTETVGDEKAKYATVNVACNKGDTFEVECKKGIFGMIVPCDSFKLQNFE
ncbi:MAG: hypothetical protein K6E54_06965 [Bacteroidaceae bacterium]|nr:hypothetical protein [Bacteroidaceae bacterium]